MEAQVIMEMLEANGVPAQAVEDQSGVSLWAFGTISQFHKPKIWVDQASVVQAAELIRTYEEQKRQLPPPGARERDRLTWSARSAGRRPHFPALSTARRKSAPTATPTLDVGDLPWDEDFGTSDE